MSRSFSIFTTAADSVKLILKTIFELKLRNMAPSLNLCNNVTPLTLWQLEAVPQKRFLEDVQASELQILRNGII